MSEYDIQNSSEFLGFISGVVSQDNDLEKMFLDSFLKISKAEDEELGEGSGTSGYNGKEIWGFLHCKSF